MIGIPHARERHVQLSVSEAILLQEHRNAPERLACDGDAFARWGARGSPSLGRLRLRLRTRGHLQILRLLDGCRDHGAQPIRLATV